MNDRERILITILERLSLTQTLCLNGVREDQFKDHDGREYVHFGGYDDRKVEKGDLVLCQTTGLHDWKMGFVHEVISFDTCVIREIGSNRLCNVSNEKFVRIAGIDKNSILEGDQYEFSVKVVKAFRNGGEYLYRYGGLEFMNNNICRIWIREAFGGVPHPSKPFYFDMKWSKRTSIKGILSQMKVNGYGSKEFEKIEAGNV